MTFGRCCPARNLLWYSPGDGRHRAEEQGQDTSGCRRTIRVNQPFVPYSERPMEVALKSQHRRTTLDPRPDGRVANRRLAAERL